MREGPIPMTAALTRENRDTDAGRRRGEDQATEKKHPESVVSRNWDPPTHTHSPNSALCILLSVSGRQRLEAA